MSNKPFNNLNEIDQKLRRLRPVGWDQKSPKITIEMIEEFEYFNTRPYHNYETFSDGYRIKDHKTGITVQAEDLNEAVNLLIKKDKL
ncbi:MAG: hypothetical protein WD512_13570 [Candidatus Paceibacterota bacterium]